MSQPLSQRLAELQELVLELAALPAGDARQQKFILARAKSWRDAAIAAADQAGSLGGEQADELCRALLAAAGRLEVVCASAAAQQGGSPPTRWLPTTVKLLHGCAALASTCPDAAAPAVAALWRSGRILLAHSTGTIAAAVGALAVGGRDASGVFAAINSHAKPFIALLECSSSAPPEAAHAPLQGLADWLLAAAQALRTLRPTHGLSAEYAVCLGRVLELLLLLARQPRSQLDPQMQRRRQAPLCAAVLDVVLPQLTATAAGLSLPAERRRAWCTWPHAAQCAAAVTCRLLELAVYEQTMAAIRDSGGPEAARLARLLQSAATLVQHMPAGSERDAEHADQLLTLLEKALLCHMSIDRARGISSSQLQQARQLLPLLPRLASLMQLDGRSQPAREQVLSAASRLLYYLVGPATPCNEGDELLVRSLADVPDWCAAVSAALRMLPTAAQAAQQAEQQQADAQWQRDAGALALPACLLAEAFGQLCLTASGRASTADVPAAAAALHSLAQLHTTACRAVAWRAAGDACRWLPCLADAVHFDAIVSTPMAAACFLCCANHAQNPNWLPEEALRQLESLAVAHLAALSELAGPDPTAHGWLHPTAVHSTWEGLVGVLQFGPAALAASPSLQQLFVSCMCALLSTGEWHLRLLQQSVFQASTARTPLLGALLLVSEALGESGASRLATISNQLAPVILNSLVTVLERTEQAAIETLAAAARSQSSSEAEARLLATLRERLAALDRVAGGPAGGQETIRFCAQLWTAVAAAGPLAAALLDWWRRTEAQQAAALELAQAAARRSCAYLRCANLGGEGGPAAGEGEGSMRCSACRAVWYCSTACSHADWREGGHRRVCKALGAARAAEKERRRQVAAEAAAEAAAGGAEVECEAAVAPFGTPLL